MNLAEWITTYIASYLEDLADVNDLFTLQEAVTLGQAGASAIKNITEKFYDLSPEDREATIQSLHQAQFPLVDDFVQQFIPSGPICQAGIDLIKQFEGCRLDAYQDPAGIWTIGYGHTHGVNYGQSITQAEADKYLLEDITEALGHVSTLVTVPLSENQRAALTSFVFNLGAANLQKSTLLRQLNEGNYECVPVELLRWVHAGGKRLQGLVNRRQAEGDLFLKEV